MKRQKGQKTEKQTANVQIARTVGVVFSLSILFIVHEPRLQKWIFVAPPMIPSEIGIKLKLKV